MAALYIIDADTSAVAPKLQNLILVLIGSEL